MSLEVQDHLAILNLDDGKANAVGYEFIDAVEAALERSQADARALLIAGRPGVFSAGFNLKEIQKGPAEAAALVHRGGEMLLRVFEHPQPVIVACTGHSMAAGALLMLAADTRIGAAGDFKIGLNETAIDMALPVFGTEIARCRLAHHHLTAAVTQARLYSPEDAVPVGYLDEVVEPEAVVRRATSAALQLAELPHAAYAANKTAVRGAYADVVRSSLAN